MAEALREDVVSEIVGRERKALDRWGNGDPGGFVELSAPEVTYLDPYLERRLDGREALRSYYASLAGKVRIDRYELLNPKVQVHGDVAILTFNYVSWSKNAGKPSESRWNCTEVYSRVDGEWRIIQTHWSLTRPGTTDSSGAGADGGREGGWTRYVITLSRTDKPMTEALVRGHVAHLKELDRQGRLVLCGPFQDHKGGMVIVKTASLDEARRIAEADPLVREGAETYELRTWELSCEANNHMGMG